MHRTLGLAAVLAALGPLCAGAADTGGRFSADGFGNATCANFTKAHAERSNDLYIFAGYIDGYFTGVNRLEPNTYDLTPWQSVELLVAKMARYCEANANDKFLDALNKLAATLFSARLTTQSALRRFENAGQAVLIYEAVLVQVTQRLAGFGFPAAEGSGDAGLSAALAGYQASQNLPASGLPDLATLNLLLR